MALAWRERGQACSPLVGTLLLLLLAGTPAYAVNQVRVSGFADFNFGTYPGTGALSSDVSLCVYSTTGSYVVTVRGSGGGSSFAISSGAHTIEYAAYWHDTSIKQGNVQVTAGSPLSNQQNADTTQTDCGGVKNANLEVRFSESALQSGRAGNYSGTISVMVEPL